MNNLKGRVALITGVSRKTGIGFGIAKRLASMGADLFLHSYAPYDRTFPSIEVCDPESIVQELSGYGVRVGHLEADFQSAISRSSHEDRG
jgi:3-oxoacyl-[acyl-carrier protein] reductase